MTSTLERPVKAPAFQGVSLRRKLTNHVATVLVTLSLLVALIPLAWVLYSVIVRGWGALTSATWFTNSQAGMTTFTAGGGAYHAIVGTLLQGIVCSLISIPIGVMVGVYLVEYGGGRGWARSPRSWWTSSPVCPRSSPRCSSTHCGWPRSGSAGPASRCHCRWCC